MYRFNCLVLIIIAFILSCSETDDNIYIYHPTQENLNSDVTSALKSEYSIKSLENNSLKKKIENKKLITSIGNLSEKVPEIFSDIYTVGITHNELFIFQRGNFKISVFDFEGNFVKDIHALGRGPNEVQQPTNITVSNDTLYIVDGFNVKYIDLTQPNQPIEIFYSSENHRIEDICTLNDKMILRFFSMKMSSGVNEFSIYHSLNMQSKETERSFGIPYKANNIKDSKYLSDGDFVCNEMTDTIVSTMFILPYITAYDVRGHIKWNVEVEEFKPILHRQDNVGVGGMSFRWHEDSFQHTSYTQLLNFNEFVILQIITFENFLNENDRFQNDKLRTDTYLIDSETGESEFLGSVLPRILAINEHYLITEKDEEFPAIEVFAI
jgi:hypothetical protein